MSEKRKPKFNERGFRVYADFKDEMGANVRIVESSIATRRCVWIQNEVCFCGADKEPIGNAHLTVAMARRVIKALQRFVEAR